MVQSPSYHRSGNQRTIDSSCRHTIRIGIISGGDGLSQTELISRWRERFEIPGVLEFHQDETRGFPHHRVLSIRTPHATATVLPQGAQVLGFLPNGCDHDLLFVSQEADWTEGKPLRGGIPICFPWFSSLPSNPTAPAHGWARNAVWNLIDARSQAEAIALVWELEYEGWQLQLTTQVGQRLRLELVARSLSDQLQRCEIAFHTYLSVSRIESVEVQGLQSLPYFDQLTGVDHRPQEQAVAIDEEIDRIYWGDDPLGVVVDRGWNRRITLSSQGAGSVVLWNPWIAKSRRMADFGDNEYQQMLCLETANVRRAAWEVEPHGERRLVLEIACQSID
ncbi:MAG: D-hexose-6-phosphate mutarotase [Pirellulaceae bacterium]|jgi:glucose-6-phosphate 1-epimerase